MIIIIFQERILYVSLIPSLIPAVYLPAALSIIIPSASFLFICVSSASSFRPLVLAFRFIVNAPPPFMSFYTVLSLAVQLTDLCQLRQMLEAADFCCFCSSSDQTSLVCRWFWTIKAACAVICPDITPSKNVSLVQGSSRRACCSLWACLTP